MLALMAFTGFEQMVKGGTTMRERQPLVSLVTSVRGNALRVRGFLAALAEQRFPLERLEVVLVDNDPLWRQGSVDLAASGSWPFPVRVVREPRAGLSRGRNRGILTARGRFVAFTDPDVIPDLYWLTILVDAAEEEGASIVGGRTETVYPEGSVVPLRDAAALPLRECHGPPEWPQQRTGHGWPYWITTANMLVERAAALQVGPFRTDLGRRGRLPLDCEDLEWVDRAAQQGLKVVIEPAAVVTHPVGREQTTARWFLIQGICHGVCVARMHSSVRVHLAAIQADRQALALAFEALVMGWGFLDRASAVRGMRDLVRIGAYHAERIRLLHRSKEC
ncbi:glycosyltransferase [Streptosporangium sp. NPDC000239]|uniref:glycosyltransferase family 2 protein n=1 Tax=Streptosporangium sp. NPDC000239 TaxID=3154248 RepID=UPI0033266EB3